MGKSQNNNGGNANQSSNSNTSSKSSGGTSSAGSTSKSNSDSTSNYQTVKEGWGSRSNFQASHGLKMDPDGFEEGNAILDGYRQHGK